MPPACAATALLPRRPLPRTSRLRARSCVSDELTPAAVLIGTNDARASLGDEHARRAMKQKKLPVRPSLTWYRENLAAITERLTKETGARIALLSLPVLGQDPAAPPALACATGRSFSTSSCAAPGATSPEGTAWN